MGHTYSHMKTTVQIDEAKLKEVTRMTGIKTRRGAIDFALDQAHRVAKDMKVLKGNFYDEKDPSAIIASKYNIAECALKVNAWVVTRDNHFIVRPA